MFCKVPQSSLGILRVPKLPPPLEHPPLKNPTIYLNHSHSLSCTSWEGLNVDDSWNFQKQQGISTTDPANYQKLVVATQIFFNVHPETWGFMIQIDEHNFRDGLVQPPIFENIWKFRVMIFRHLQRPDPRFTDNLRAPIAPATLGSVGIRSHSILDGNIPWMIHGTIVYLPSHANPSKSTINVGKYTIVPWMRHGYDEIPSTLWGNLTFFARYIALNIHLSRHHVP